MKAIHLSPSRIELRFVLHVYTSRLTKNASALERMAHKYYESKWYSGRSYKSLFSFLS